MSKDYDYALISGGFDPVHIGHLAMIKDAKRISKYRRPGTITLLSTNGEIIQKIGPATREKVEKGAIPKLIKEFPLIENIGVPEGEFFTSTSIKFNLFFFPIALKSASLAANLLAKHSILLILFSQTLISELV